MKQFVLVWGMHKQANINSKNAFTLIEVMVAVMIISVVIMALIQMYANNTHIFSSLKQQTKANQHASLLIGNDDYGFENKSVVINDLLREFDLRSDLRRELKSMKAEIIYKELEQLDMGEQNSNDKTVNDVENTSNMIIEIGQSIIKTNRSSAALLRLRVQ